MEPEINKEPLF